MGFLEAIPIPADAKPLVIGLLPFIALAIGIVVTKLAEKTR